MGAAFAGRATFIALALALTGCPGSPLYQGSTPRKTNAELFNERWTGKTEDDVIVQYGRPTEVLRLSNGNHVNSYHREIALSESRGSVGAYGGVAGGSSQSESTTIYCDRRFEIDETTKQVLRAVIAGSRCDYNQ